jgi:glycosyltransferase involved in cell wall biosynthesis
MEVHPTGVSLPGVVDAERADALRLLMGIHPDDRVVLYVGRIAWEKNCRLLLESFARLPENCHLVMVGGGPDGDAQAEFAAELGMDRRTHFVGPVSREGLVDYYAMADVFAFPSSTETQGLVLGEAQSCGLPCVAVTGGGAAEFVRNDIDALVVPPELDAFAGALLRIVSDDVLRHKMSGEALASPVRPTVAEMVSHIRQMYMRLIAEHRIAPGA